MPSIIELLTASRTVSKHLVLAPFSSFSLQFLPKSMNFLVYVSVGSFTQARGAFRDLSWQFTLPASLTPSVQLLPVLPAVYSLRFSSITWLSQFQLHHCFLLNSLFIFLLSKDFLALKIKSFSVQ